MSAGRAPWTGEELVLLEELSGRNVSLQVIALKLRRTVAAVTAKAAQRKIAVRTRSPLIGTSPAYDTFLAGEGQRR